jgi:predicted TPR repeat methyltransferase
LGNILAACGRADEALASYDAAIAIRPGYAQGYHNRGKVLADLQRTSEAISSYQQALTLQPDEESAHQALAALYERADRLEDACQQYRWLVEHQPSSKYGYLRLGQVLRKVNRLGEAREIYRQWLGVEPNDALAQHFLAACGEGPLPSRATDEYIRAAFARAADDFDGRLAELGYRVPGLVQEAVRELRGAEATATWDVADLGCGTGLCAPGLRPVAGRLVGVDLSPQMLAKARSKGLYDELVEGELTAFLQQRPTAFDLLVSGDTLIYLGQLEPLFEAAAHALREGGALIVTVERQTDEGSSADFTMNRFGRYVHRADYILRVLADAGFNVLTSREEALRSEAGVPVPGLLVVAKKR